MRRVKMLDCPTSVVHRLGDDDVDDEPMVDHETIESRYGVSHVAQVETYLAEHGPAHSVEIAAALGVSEPIIVSILSALKGAGRAVWVDQVELPPALGSKRRRRVRSLYALVSLAQDR